MLRKKRKFVKRPKINRQIRAKELRVVDDKEGNLGVLSLEDAIKKAEEKELDLIEISPTAKPPVAKIMDYGKFQYQEKRKLKLAKKKISTTETKVIQIGLSTSPHDTERKTQKASQFLREGHRVKVILILKGRAKWLPKKVLDERIEQILGYLTEDYKIGLSARKAPRGIYFIIESANRGKK